MKTTSSTGSRRLLALMLSLLMTFGLWTADLRGAVAHAEVTPIETINDFELNAGGTVKATWDQAAQTLTVHGSGKIENGKWKELARKFSEENFKGYDGWANNSDFTLRFESNAILLPDDTRIEDDGKFLGFFQEFDGEIELPADLNVSNVTNMNRMFFAIDKADPDVSAWNVSKVTDMSYMFAFSQKANPNVSAWDVSEVTDMSYTFGYVEKANPDVSAWDVSKVINMDFMFYSADEFRGVGDNVKRWRPGALRTMERMFDRSGAEVLDLSSWGVLNIEAYGAFEGMKGLKSLKLKGLCNAGLNNFKGPYSYTKDGGAPVKIADQNENVFFDDNAEYIVTLLSDIGMKNITVKFLTPDGHVIYTGSFLAAKGLSFTDRKLFSRFSGNWFIGFAPNTPDKVNIVGEENEITFEVPLKYASTDPSKFGVDFDEGNGRSSFVLVPKNTPVPKPEDPQRPGHIFRGWYKEDTFTTPWEFSDPVTEDMVLYAKWERDTNVTFYTVTVAGGTSALATASEGEWVRVKVGPIPSGQRFAGWTGDAGVVFEDVTSPSTFFRMPRRDVTITAKFAPVGQKVVSFDSTGGSSVPPISVAPGNPIPEPAPPTRAGYTFDGWYIDTSYTTPWNFSDPVTADMTLYAKWIEKKYAITVVGGSASQTTAESGESVDITANPAPIGQRFVRWSSDKEVTFADATAPSTTFAMPESDVTITANFAPIGNLIVAFDSQGGSAVTPAYVAPNTPVTEPAPPTRAGYTFAGWHTGLGVPWNFSDAVTRNMTLYAKWIEKEYTITVVGGSASQTTAKKGERVDITADSAPSGQHFIGWSSDVPTFFGNHIQPVSDFYMPASDVTITAHFAPIGELRVTFISQEGSSVPPVSVAPNTPVTEPAPPTREGYTFAGWHTGLGVPWNFSDPITRNMELIAVWIANTYTVTVIGGTSDIATAKMGDIGGLTADPAPSGQRFIGWSSDVGIILGNAAAPSTRFLMPASNVTITANFAPIGNLIVAFDSQRGSSVPSVNVAPNTPVAEPAPPTRAGYSFEGWYTDTAYTTPWNFSDPVTADMILYAKWSTGTSTYTVRVTGGTSDLATAAAGARVTVTADPAPIGQRFVNWTSDVGVAFANVTTPSTTFVMPSSNVEVTANFAPIGHLAVSFDSQGGSAVAPAYVAPGTPAAPPVPPTRAGYTFDGWYTDTAYTTPWNFSDPVTADMILYAKWNSSTSTGTGSGGGDKDKPEKPEMPKAPKEDLIQKPDIVEVFDESSPKHETKAPSAMKTAGVLKIGSLDYQALEKGVLVKKKLDTPPIIEKGKTMLPARAVGELLGVSVSYNSKSKTAVFVYEGKKVELTIGKKTMKVNGVEKAMSAPMMMRNGRVLLPLRDVQKALKELGLEASVNWEHKTKTITIQAKR